MAVRTPLYAFGSPANPREMSSDMITAHKNKMIQEYGDAPSNTITVVLNDTGNMTSMIDTRFTSGAYVRGAAQPAAPPASGVTATQQTTVIYNKMLYQTNTAIIPDDTNSRRFPVYITASGDIQAMTLNDMIDTYAKDVVDTLVSTDRVDGTHFISTDASLDDTYYENQGIVYKDTTFDTSLTTTQINALVGTANNIDRALTINNYYLYRVNTGTHTPGGISYTAPLYIRSDGNLQTYTNAEWETILQEVIRYTTLNVSGYRLQYAIEAFSNTEYSSNALADAAAVGITLGSRMHDREVTGSSVFSRQLNADDYRRQRFPTGDNTVKTRYYLTLRKF